MSTKIAIVTGGNKGIGTEIVKGLCRSFEGDVFLTARDEGRGRATVSQLENEGFKPKFHQLDINSLESIQKLRDFIVKNYGGLDVLVNNAGIAFKNAATESVYVQARDTVNTNYFGTLAVCKELFPLLHPHARVANVSSLVGKLSFIPDQEVRNKFLAKDLTLDNLNGLMNQYIQDCKDGVQKEKGWSPSTYAMSKIAVNALTFIQQRDFDKDAREDLIVNCVHPGYIATDMSSFKGTGTTAEGARAPLYLALLPPNVKEPKGQFIWEDSTVASWE